MANTSETPDSFQAKQAIVRRLQRVPLNDAEILDILHRGARVIMQLKPQPHPFEVEPNDVATVRASTQPVGFVIVGRVWSGERSWLVTWNLESGVGNVSLERLENGYGWNATF